VGAGRALLQAPRDKKRDRAEMQRRFKKTAKLVRKMKTYGLNQFADVTLKEFHQTYCGFIPDRS
jgi:3-methyladenine DNA glycosylase Tag